MTEPNSKYNLDTIRDVDADELIACGAFDYISKGKGTRLAIAIDSGNKNNVLQAVKAGRWMYVNNSAIKKQVFAARIKFEALPKLVYDKLNAFCKAYVVDGFVTVKEHDRGYVEDKTLDQIAQLALRVQTKYTHYMIKPSTKFTSDLTDCEIYLYNINEQEVYKPTAAEIVRENKDEQEEREHKVRALLIEKLLKDLGDKHGFYYVSSRKKIPLYWRQGGFNHFIRECIEEKICSVLRKAGVEVNINDACHMRPDNNLVYVEGIKLDEETN